MTQAFDDILAAKRVELGEVTDNLGKPIEAGILDTVAALQLLGFATSGSCEGHVDWGCPWPWVDITATSAEPDYRWQGQAEAKVRIMTELGLEEADLMAKDGRKVTPKAYNNRLWAWVDAEGPDESEAYVDWVGDFQAEYLRLMGYVRTFEAARVKEGQPWLVLERWGLARARLLVVDAGSFRDSKAGDDGIAERLAARQALVRRFTGFLMDVVNARF